MIANLIGAVLLWLAGTNWFENYIWRQNYEPLEEGIQSLRRKRELTWNDPEFHRVVKLLGVFFDYNSVVRTPVKIKVQRGEKNNSWIIVQHEHDKEIAIASLRSVQSTIDEEFESGFNFAIDRVARSGITILSIGFALQLFAYFIRNFVV